MKENKFNIKEIKKIINSEGKIEKICIELDGDDKNLLSSSNDIIIKSYSIKQRV